MALPGISRFADRVALVTGGSVGIGAAICKTLVEHGLIVVACARNVDPIIEQAQEYAKLGYKGTLHSYKCDVGNENEVEGMFHFLEEKFRGVDVCINNAGYAVRESLLESDAAKIREMLNLNVIGLIMCTKLAIKSMMDRGVNDGHIIQVNSMLGHRVRKMIHCYSATKFAVTAITEGFRKELHDANSRIRITSVSPGMTKTHANYAHFGKTKADSFYDKMPHLLPEDVANAILHALSQPQHVQVHDILFEATGIAPP